ncbi:hypothetical protein I6E31_09625 [Fusobacterium varium]|nr:hypothetical protein [Fusobacterium varium]
MRKKLFLLLYLFFTFVCFSKNIYVVYDDSKSMKKDNRSIYANYAMQTLISLLEKDDNLIITKMSDLDNDFRNKMIINLKDIPKELEFFREKIVPKSNLTPYKSVSSVVEYMKINAKQDDINWLIMITDGNFEDGNPIPELEKIKEDISSLIAENDVRPIFLLIGSNKKELDKYEEQSGVEIWKEIFGQGEYPKIYKSVGQHDIIEKMEEIAQLLTNKSSKKEEKNYKIDGNDIKFLSLFPLKKVIILNQKDKDGKLQEIDNVKIGDKEEKLIEVYTPKKATKNVDLYANVIHINVEKGDKDIEELRISFKDGVPSNIKIFPEVAGEFEVKITDINGKELDGRVLKMAPEDEIKVYGFLKNANDKEPMKYIDGTQVYINYGGKRIDLEYNPKTKQYEKSIKIEKGKKSIDAVAEFDGYFFYQSDIYIINGDETVSKIVKFEEKKEIKKETPKPVVVKKVEVKKVEEKKIYDLKIENIDTKVITQNDLKDKEIIFRPILNNKSLNREEFKKFKLKFKDELNGKLQREDNFWSYRIPTYDGVTKFRNPQGKYKIKVVCENKDEKVKLEKEIEIQIEKIGFWEAWGQLISIILGFIVAIILGIGYWKKSRFLKNKKIEIAERFDGLDLPISRKVELKASILNKLTPYLKESKKIEGITFIANNTNIKVLGEELDKLFNTGAVKKIFINGDLIGKDELKDKKEHILFTGNGIKIIYQEGKVKEYTYY